MRSIILSFSAAPLFPAVTIQKSIFLLYVIYRNPTPVSNPVRSCPITPLAAPNGNSLAGIIPFLTFLMPVWSRRLSGTMLPAIHLCADRLSWTVSHDLAVHQVYFFLLLFSSLFFILLLKSFSQEINKLLRNITINIFFRSSSFWHSLLLSLQAVLPPLRCLRPHRINIQNLYRSIMK